MPKPVSQTAQVALLTRILAGLISLWMRPRPWSLASAAARPMAKRKNEVISQGCPKSRNRGSPPGSSLNSVSRPLSVTSLSGRAAQPGSSSPRSSKACRKRAMAAGDGGVVKGTAAMTGSGSPSGTARDRRNSPSSHRVSGTCADNSVMPRPFKFVSRVRCRAGLQQIRRCGSTRRASEVEKVLVVLGSCRKPSGSGSGDGASCSETPWITYHDAVAERNRDFRLAEWR